MCRACPVSRSSGRLQQEPGRLLAATVRARVWSPSVDVARGGDGTSLDGEQAGGSGWGAHSETAQAVRVRILVRVAVAVMHQSPGNASDPKTPPSGASAKLPPITFPPYAKIALVHD